MNSLQLVSSIGVPSLLVVLSWIHNNTRLSRLESGLDSVNRRMDEFQRVMHNDMLAFQASLHSDILSFQASLLSEVSSLRERVAVVEVSR